MNLKEFVRESLVSILEGVKEAQDQASRQQVGGAINPRFDDSGAIRDGDIQSMEFDIAVSVSEKTEGSGGGNLKVVGILGAGGQISKADESGSVSRIKFTLKVLPPFTTVPRHPVSR